MRTATMIGLVALFGLGLVVYVEVDQIEPGRLTLFVNGSGDISKDLLTTIAVCDPALVFSKYNKATELAAGLEVEVKNTKKIVQDIAKKIDIKQKYLTGLKKHSKEYENGFEELATIKAEYRAYVKTMTANLNERKAVLITSGLADVYRAIDEVAKANGVNIVLAKKASDEDRRTVLYADKTLDITDEVIAMVNGEVVAE